MVHYKLVYFDARGRAEVARLLFVHAGVEYEDFRLGKDEWPGQYQTEAPFGKLPWLEVDGKKLSESYAINRYLARRFGLAGKDEWEQAQVDAIADLYKDVQNEVRPFFVALREQSADKDKLFEEVYKPAMNRFLPILEKLLKESVSGFFVKSGYTWVDFLYAEMLASAQTRLPDMLESAPEVKKHIERVRNIPKIKEYIANRKETPF